MKERRSKLKRAFGVFLVAMLGVLELSGCGKKSGESLVDKASSGSKDYVFNKEILEIVENADYSNVAVVGGKIFCSTYANEGFLTVSSFNSDGSDMNVVKIPEAENEGHGYMCFDADGDIYTVLNIYDYSNYEDPDEQPQTYEDGAAGNGEESADRGSDTSKDTDSSDAGTASENSISADAESADADGAAGAESVDSSNSESSIADSNESAETSKDAAESKIVVDEDPGMGGYEESEDQQYLVKYDAKGYEQFRIDLNKDLPSGEYFTVYGMIVTDDSELLVSSNQGIKRLKEESQSFETIVDFTDPSSEFYQSSVSIYKGFAGKYFVSVWGDKGLELRSFDPVSGEMGEKSSQFTTYEDFTFFSGNGYDLYVSKQDGFYGYDLEKDALTKILDYVDSDINVGYSLATVAAISDTEFIANIPDEDYNYRLCRLTKVPADQVKDRTILTLAGNYVDYTIRQRVYKFNEENSDYKIKIVDYSTLANADDYNAGATQFNLDIVSGNTPDIMVFSGDDPVDSYINKGLFLDLTANLKSDEILSKTRFVDNVFEAFKTGDKIYMLVPSFMINTISTKASYLKGKDTLSLKDAEGLMDEMGVKYADSFGPSSRDEVLYMGMLASGNRFVDWENKKCSFDSEEFIEFLEFVNKFPKEVSESVWENYKDTCYREGTSLFASTYLSNFRTYRRSRDGQFGEDITLIGFPNASGVNCSVIMPQQRIAISAKTKYGDAAWDFVRYFLLPEYQDKIEYEFPITKDAYDKMAENSMEKYYWTDEDGKKHYEDDTYYVGDQEVVIQPLTKEDVQYINNFIGSLSLVYSGNQNVYNIVTEEVAPYFEGQKSAAEVAGIIQSRVSIYVNENS